MQLKNYILQSFIKLLLIYTQHYQSCITSYSNYSVLHKVVVYNAHDYKHVYCYTVTHVTAQSVNIESYNDYNIIFS